MVALYRSRSRPTSPVRSAAFLCAVFALAALMLSASVAAQSSSATSAASSSSSASATSAASSSGSASGNSTSATSSGECLCPRPLMRWFRLRGTDSLVARAYALVLFADLERTELVFIALTGASASASGNSTSSASTTLANAPTATVPESLAGTATAPAPGTTDSGPDDSYISGALPGLILGYGVSVQMGAGVLAALAGGTYMLL